MSAATHLNGPCSNCWGGTKLVDGKHVFVDPHCKGNGSMRPAPRPATYGPTCHAPYSGRYHVEWCGLPPGHYPATPHGPRVIPGAMGATEDAT